MADPPKHAHIHHDFTVWTTNSNTMMYLLLLAAAAAAASVAIVDASVTTVHYYPILSRPDAATARERSDVGRRGRRRDLQAAFAIIEEDISFDGDVNKIKALALQKALGELATNEGGGGGTTNGGDNTTDVGGDGGNGGGGLIEGEGLPDDGDNDPFSCAGRNPDAYFHVLTWTYSVEYKSGSDLTVLLPTLEETLQIALAQRLLSCINDEAASAGIVAERALPSDVVLEGVSCPAPLVNSTANDCNVYEGRMRLFLNDESLVPQANYLARTYIEALMAADDNEFPNANLLAEQVGHGLVKVTYLGPPITDPDGILGNSEEPKEDGNLGNASIAFVAVGSAALIVIVGSVYYWRRISRSPGDTGASQAAGTSVESNTLMLNARHLGRSNSTGSSGGHSLGQNHPISPFSEMLPNAYKFNEDLSVLSAPNSGLSAVMEASDDENMTTDRSSVQPPHASGSGSIVMSESGYTTEAGDDESSISFEYPQSLYNKKSPKAVKSKHNDGGTLLQLPTHMLGATQRPGVNVHMSETESEVSSDMALEDAMLLAGQGGLAAAAPRNNKQLLNNVNSPEESNDADDEASELYVEHSTQLSSSHLLQPTTQKAALSPPDLLDTNLALPLSPRHNDDLLYDNQEIMSDAIKSQIDRKTMELLLQSPLTSDKDTTSGDFDDDDKFPPALPMLSSASKKQATTKSNMSADDSNADENLLFL